MPAPGFQAIILCGPGSSFPTFTANPDENPKALMPIANRPMVWYPIDFCYRMGVTSKCFVFIFALFALIDAMGSQLWLSGLPITTSRRCQGYRYHVILVFLCEILRSELQRFPNGARYFVYRLSVMVSHVTYLLYAASDGQLKISL